MARTIDVRLRPRAVRRFANQNTRANMELATVFLRDQVKQKLNRGQPRRTTEGGNLIGLDPSEPGEPPKKISGVYMNSIRQRVISTSLSELVGLVGTDQKRAPALEFGNRKGTLAPRPHFRPALRENRFRLLRIIARGKRGA